MNKRMVTLILVILISFCFLGIVVAENATDDGADATDSDKAVDNDKDVDKDKVDDDNKTKDKDDTKDKNKTDDKSKKGDVIAKGSGNDIKFSDGYRGFRLDYSKHAASSGDDFKSVSASKASHSNTLKRAVVECYRQDSEGSIGKVMASVIKTGSAGGKVGEAIAESHESISNHDVVKIDNDTEAVFDFEVLKSVSGNESNYFAYTVSFRTINDDGNINQTNNLTNLTNTTNTTNLTNTTNATNITNTTNVTNLTQPDNGTNATFFKELYDYLLALANALYDAWKPIVDTLINDFLMMVNALEDLVNLFENFMGELQSLVDALEELIDLLESIWKELSGILKLFAILLAALDQLLYLIASVLNFIAGLISAIISLIQQILGLIFGLINFIIGLIQQLLGLLFALINFLLDLLNQLISLLQAIFDFLKSAGSFLINVIENAVVIVVAFVAITIGAFIYNRIR